jgi:hypothetical protein
MLKITFGPQLKFLNELSPILYGKDHVILLSKGNFYKQNVEVSKSFWSCMGEYEKQ